MPSSRSRTSTRSTKPGIPAARHFMRRSGPRGTTSPGPEILALQQRIADAVERQHQLCAAKQACEAELNHLMKNRRGDDGDAELAELCGDKMEEMRLLAASAESAAAEIGRFSGDLLIFQLRNGLQR
jgi:hypothetical protein